MAIRSKFKWWEQCVLSQGLTVTLLTVSVFQKKGNQRTHRALRSQGHRAAGSLRVSEATSAAPGALERESTRSDLGSAVHNKNQQTGISYVHRHRYPARAGTNACWEFCSTRDTSRLRITGAGTETSRNLSKYHIESWSSTPWCSRLVSETSPTFPRFDLKNTPHSPKAST